MGQIVTKRAGKVVAQTITKASQVPKVFPLITAWSFSLHRRYNSCPRMVALEKLVKVKMENKGMQGGIDMHAQAEDYLRGAPSKKLPKALALVKDHATALKKDKTAQPELQFAFTRDWKVSEWFAPDTWVRIKVDVRNVIKPGKPPKVVGITDWKGGRPNARWDLEQAELYALGEFKLSRAAEVRTSFQHTDTGDVTEGVFLIAEEKSLQKEWDKRTKRMLADKRFDPTPGRQCAWCPFRKTASGGNGICGQG
jgi:hypothetical protein